MSSTSIIYVDQLAFLRMCNGNPREAELIKGFLMRQGLLSDSSQTTLERAQRAISLYHQKRLKLTNTLKEIFGQGEDVFLAGYFLEYHLKMPLELIADKTSYQISRMLQENQYEHSKSTCKKQLEPTKESTITVFEKLRMMYGDEAIVIGFFLEEKINISLEVVISLTKEEIDHIKRTNGYNRAYYEKLLEDQGFHN